MRLLASLLVLSCLPAAAEADDAPAAAGAVKPPTAIGTAHPIRPLSASPDARWVALCEARKDTNKDGRISVGPGFNGLYGDQMEAFLVLGAGPGLPIEDLVESDPTGRFAVILRKTKLVLLDTTTNREVDLSKLGAYAKPDRAASGAYLGVSFDAMGTHLSYVAVRKKQVVVVVRDLVGETEVTIDPGPGKLWSAIFAPTGSHLLVEALPPHADPKQAIKFPTHRWPESFREPNCITRVYGDVINRTGDKPVTRIATTAGGTAVEVPGYINLLGDSTLRRDPSGALVLDDTTGAHELLPATCKGVVDGLDPAKQRVLAHCTARGAKAPLLLVSIGLAKDLGVAAGESTEDNDTAFGRHTFSTTRDADDTIVDVETGKRRVAPFNQRVLATLGDKTLVSRNERLIMIDGPGETDLGAIVGEYPKVLSAGTMRYIEPLVVDMATGKLIGIAPEREVPLSKRGTLVRKIGPSVLAVATSGQLLATYSLNPGSFPSGPLEWLMPVPPAPPSPAPPAPRPAK